MTRRCTVRDVAPLRILVVCTANVCRSPMGAALLQSHLAAAGLSAQVSSAGTLRTGLAVDPDAVKAASEWGVDISGHVPRLVSRAIVDDEGADLIVTMARRHLREVAVMSRNVFARTFTARELGRRLTDFGGTPADLPSLLAAIGGDRRPSQMMTDDLLDDIPDPYGTGLANVRHTATELDQLAQLFARRLARVDADGQP
jgi:protein-tyrosine phosphatase